MEESERCRRIKKGYPSPVERRKKGKRRMLKKRLTILRDKPELYGAAADTDGHR
jgi:hypothetical protein